MSRFEDFALDHEQHHHSKSWGVAKGARMTGPVGASLPGAAPSEAAIAAAFNVCPERFKGVQPYGGVMEPMLAPEQIAVMLRAAYAVDFGAALEAGPSPLDANALIAAYDAPRAPWMSDQSVHLFAEWLVANYRVIRGESLPHFPNEPAILAAIQRVLDSHEAQSPRAILNAIRGVGSRGQEP